MRKILRQTQRVAMFVCPATRSSMDPTNKVQGEGIDHQLGSIYIIYTMYRSIVISILIISGGHGTKDEMDPDLLYSNTRKSPSMNEQQREERNEREKVTQSIIPPLFRNNI